MIPVILPPKIDTASLSCVDMVPSPRLILACEGVLAPVPPSATNKSVMPTIDPPLILTTVASWNAIVPSVFMLLITNSVLAICVVLVPLAAVGTVGIPENAVLAFSFCTKAVVASCVVLVP